MNQLSINSIEDAALKLPGPERAALAARLIDSLDPAFDTDAETAWAREIERRINEVDQGKTKMLSWEVARRMIPEGRYRDSAP
jgi:putative addiction module component (TIGR02574 family)